MFVGRVPLTANMYSSFTVPLVFGRFIVIACSLLNSGTKKCGSVNRSFNNFCVSAFAVTGLSSIFNSCLYATSLATAIAISSDCIYWTEIGSSISNSLIYIYTFRKGITKLYLKGGSLRERSSFYLSRYLELFIWWWWWWCFILCCLSITIRRAHITFWCCWSCGHFCFNA